MCQRTDDRPADQEGDRATRVVIEDINPVALRGRIADLSVGNAPLRAE
jgi:hypothetical protein